MTARNLLIRALHSGNLNLQLEEQVKDQLFYEDEEMDFALLQDCLDSGNLNFELEDEVRTFLEHNAPELNEDY